MKYALRLAVIALCGSLTVAAQILPKSNGSCGVSPSGVMSCNWLSAVPLATKANETIVNPSVRSEVRQLIVTRVRLSSGAPLNRMVEGQDELIVGMGEGELVNETKSPPFRVPISLGSVILMPKEESYVLRNTGKQALEVLVVRLH